MFLWQDDRNIYLVLDVFISVSSSLVCFWVFCINYFSYGISASEYGGWRQIPSKFINYTTISHTSSKLKPPQNFWKYWYSKELHSFIINFYIPDFLVLDIAFKNNLTGEVLWCCDGQTGAVLLRNTFAFKCDAAISCCSCASCAASSIFFVP
jgi:hypothetical protein